jgi:quercetin dioxygenase-like cupin family protein
MQVRRVVTAEHADGSSFIAANKVVEPRIISQLPGSAFHMLWSSDEQVQFPTEKPGYVGGNMFPPSEGFRFTFVTFPPDSVRLSPEEIDVEQMNRELAEKLPATEGDSHVDPESYEGNHRTDTVDMGVVLTGEVDLRVDDGVVTLRQGDCIVQGGARHAWNNHTSEPCVVAFVIVGGKRNR